MNIEHKNNQNIDGISVVVPVYNEGKSIDSTILTLNSVMASTGVDFEIIFVNDGSSDNSGDVLKNKVDLIKLVEHRSNRGYGAALKSGIRIAKYEIIVITDADGTYPNEIIPDLINKIYKKDMIVGARTGAKVAIPLIRKPAKWFLNKLANYLSGIKIPDLNSGLRVMRKNIIKKYFHLLPDGFSFTTTITLAMASDSYQIEYVPIDYLKRDGKSKIRPIHDTLNFIQLIVRTILYFNPLKVFMPIGLILISLSFGLLMYRIFVDLAFGVTIIVLFLAGIQLLALGIIADLIVRRTK